MKRSPPDRVCMGDVRKLRALLRVCITCASPPERFSHLLAVCTHRHLTLLLPKFAFTSLRRVLAAQTPCIHLRRSVVPALWASYTKPASVRPWPHQSSALNTKSDMSWRPINAVIENKLYLGSLEAAKSSRTLADRRITHIVSVGYEPIPADDPASPYRHLRIPVEDVDYADLLIHLPTACQFIHEALSHPQGRVLVHCVNGLCRSAAVVAAYLMRSERILAVDAVERVCSVRQQVWINPGFREQLVLFDLCQYFPRQQTPSTCNGGRSWIATSANYPVDDFRPRK
ncbi:protein-tyrosine phosphatase-like protein [Amylocystis lapponica]|nr:protein-tyrosine phosphatase-like protein [Amylocystis lapponica]